MPFTIANGVALITGASQGIGKAIAIQLAKAGVRVAITSNDAHPLEQTENEIKKSGGDVISLVGDATIEKDIYKIVEKTAACFGPINILINNVGYIGNMQAFENITTEEWHHLFTLNVMSGVHFTKAILPYMKKNNGGRIIFISSEKAIEPGINMSHYAMSKAAILSITKSLANEVGKDSITVNSISPGVIVTPAWDKKANEHHLSREAYAATCSQHVLTNEPIGQAEDVASLVCYLCSTSARWITGSNFRVDGGSVKNIQL